MPGDQTSAHPNRPGKSFFHNIKALKRVVLTFPFTPPMVQKRASKFTPSGTHFLMGHTEDMPTRDAKNYCYLLDAKIEGEVPWIAFIYPGTLSLQL